MFGKDWQTSEREFDVSVERDVAIPVDDGVELVGDVIRPETDEPVPVILSASAYSVEYQYAPMTPRRGSSQRRVDPERSEPWEFYHPHDERVPLTPDEVTEFRINVSPTGAAFAPGERIGLRIACSDASAGGYSDVPHEGVRSANAKGGHLSRQSASGVTVYHDAAFPSQVALPITAGNEMGTYRSGGGPNRFDELMPYEKVQMDERPD